MRQYNPNQTATLPDAAIADTMPVVVGKYGWNLTESRAAFGFGIVASLHDGEPGNDPRLSRVTWETGDICQTAAGLYRCTSGGVGSAATWEILCGDPVSATDTANLSAGVENTDFGSSMTGRGTAAVDVWMRTAALGTPVQLSRDVEIILYRDGNDTDPAGATAENLGVLPFEEDGVNGAVAASTSVTLDDATGFFVGDRIAFEDATNGLQFRRIDAIAGNVLTLNAAITLDDNASASRVHSLSFAFWRGFRIGMECASAVDSMRGRIIR